MENSYKINENLYYIGASDRRIHIFEAIQPLNYGMAYNSYLMVNDKTYLFNTVDHSVSDQFFENLEHCLNGKPLDYFVIQHMEPDHANCIKEIILRYPNVNIILNAQILNMVKNFFRDLDTTKLNLTIVKDLDKVQIGDKELLFVFAPMVHWPEVMMVYETTTKTLFSADAFGSYNALNGKIFFDEYNYEKEFLDEARRYYTNIVGKYGNPVQQLFNKVKGVEFDLICPLHGPVIRNKNDMAYLINKYDIWSSYTPEEKGVLIVYGSIYGNTAKAVNKFAHMLADAGVKNIKIYDSSMTDVSYLLSDAFKYSHLVIFSSSYNAGVFPKIEEFLLALKAHNFQNRKIAFVENGSWAPTAFNSTKALIESLTDCQLYDKKVTITSSLSDANLVQFEDIINFIKTDFIKEDLANLKPLFNIPYGLYICFAKDEKENKLNGCVCNTLSLVSENPNIYSIALNKSNYTTKLLQESKKISVSILHKQATQDLIKLFGYNSGKDMNKFENFTDYSLNCLNLPYLNKNYSNSFICGEIVNSVEVNDHIVFYFKVVEEKVLSYDETLTYSYYQKNIKPKFKSAGKRVGWRCKICGYLYKGEVLPDDFICPWCKHSKEDFEKVYY